MVNFRNIILAVAIALIFAFFAGFGIATFYPAPQYEDFCGDRSEQSRDLTTKEACESGGGKWNPSQVEKPVPVGRNQLLCTKVKEGDGNVTLNCETQEQVENRGFCDADFYCREDFQNAQQSYNRNVFITATGVGIIAVIVGFALQVGSVSAGLMGGGVLTIIYGVVRYWSDLPDYGRFIILGIALAILIWLGYKRINK